MIVVSRKTDVHPDLVGHLVFCTGLTATLERPFDQLLPEVLTVNLSLTDCWVVKQHNKARKFVFCEFKCIDNFYSRSRGFAVSGLNLNQRFLDSRDLVSRLFYVYWWREFNHEVPAVVIFLWTVASYSSLRAEQLEVVLC